MPNLNAVIESLTEDAGAYRTDAPPEWSQGRTLYGGITAALAAHAVKQAMPDLPPLRSCQVSFIGPASGSLTFRPEVLRQGRSSTFIGVDCTAEGGLAARLVLAYGGDRPSQVVHDRMPAPTVAEPADCEPFFKDRAPAGFFRNFEMRLAAGSRPMTGAAFPEFTLWVRHHDASGVDPTIALLALADSPPPAAMTAFPAPGPVSTMTWMLDLAQPPAAEGWRLLRSSSEQAAGGYSLQAMDVWDAEGRRLAAGRQMVAIFA